MKYAILFRLYNETLTTPSIRDWINKTKMFKTVTNLFIYFVISLFRFVTFYRYVFPGFLKYALRQYFYENFSSILFVIYAAEVRNKVVKKLNE